MVGKVWGVWSGDKPALAITCANVIADRSALTQHEIAVGDHGGDPHRVERLVIVRRESIVSSARVALEFIIEPQLLTQPDDAFGLRDPKVVNGQHDRCS